MDRILGGDTSKNFKIKWAETVPGIVNLSKTSSEKHIQQLLQYYPDLENIGN